MINKEYIKKLGGFRTRVDFDSIPTLSVLKFVFKKIISSYKNIFKLNFLQRDHQLQKSSSL